MLAELLDLVYRVYPRGMIFGGVGYKDTEEYHRQQEAVRRGAAGYPTWKALIRRLGARYEVTDRSLGLLGGSYDPAYSGYLLIPGRSLGFHVCLLGPYYAVHRTGAPGEEAAAMDVGREIEASYPGYLPIPPEIGDILVPDVCPGFRDFGEATIYDCLFSSEWEVSSGPYLG